MSDQPMIAVVNAGSSSLKFSLYDAAPHTTLQLRLHGQVDGLETSPRLVAKGREGQVLGERAWGAGIRLAHDDALREVIGFVRGLVPGLSLRGVGHRVVHGGLAHSKPVRVTPAVLAELAALTPLAPLHQPHNLSPIGLAFDLFPGVPQIACFDTAFHRSQAELAQMFALPFEFHDAGVRRYGFHGLSYEYIAEQLPKLSPALAGAKVIVLHLGNGASACAMHAGRSVASTMGFTALDGLVMGTRTGSLDPGVLLYLMDERGMDARAIESLLYRQSGLLGVSGVSSDMRALSASDSPRAQVAIDLFACRIVREIGSLAAALGGVDALVFTAGIGEHSASVRARVLAGCEWLGVALDAAANDAGAPCISQPGSRCAAWVVPTDEEDVIARHTARLLDGAAH